MKQFVLALLIVAIHATATSQILYVDKSTTGANNGSSWANAFTDLNAAVDEANTNTAIKEIRIEINGTYTGNEYFIRRSYDISGSWNMTTNTQAGSPSAATTLDGELTHRIMNIEAGVTINLSGLCFLKGGNIAANGGAIATKGNVTINRCYFKDNVITVTGTYNVEPFGNGGAISNEGILVVKGSQFINNSTTYSGGAILNRKELTVSDCLFERNVAGNRGGAIANNYYGGTIQLNKCRFTENYLVRQAGTITIRDGSGGALSLEGAGANIVNCIFDKNKAHGGGAIWTIRWMGLRNCTFFANEVYNTNIHGNGGAIYGFAGWGIGIQNCVFYT
jgi:predicted outer membrane repeat protein